ncbi:MAG TPA: hypothetical protein G4N97_00020 [Thermoflexia bacterium]|nr:hypothetical protein [Thermoflexia bacterium]
MSRRLERSEASGGRAFSTQFGLLNVPCQYTPYPSIRQPTTRAISFSTATNSSRQPRTCGSRDEPKLTGSRTML